MIKRTIILISSLCIAVILAVVFINRSYSIVLLQNGFNEKDVYQQYAFNSGKQMYYYDLVINNNHFGFINLKKGPFGIWQKSEGSMIINKTSDYIEASTSCTHYYYINTTPKTCSDEFIAGVINADDIEKLYNLPQQPGCRYSVLIYQDSGRHFALLHLTSNSTDALNSTSDYIEKNVDFQKFK